MKEKLKLPFFLALCLFISSTEATSTLPRIETKYYLDLPESFLNSLEKDQNNQPIFWHPVLQMTKVYTEENRPTYDKMEKVSNPVSSNFLSLIQIRQTDQGTQNLVYVQGSNQNTSALQSSNMDCQCRFVKDPNGINLIQTQPFSPVISQAIEPPSTSILAEDQEESFFQSKRESTNDFSLFPRQDESREPSVENDYQLLVEKNKLLEAQLENKQLQEQINNQNNGQSLLSLLDSPKNNNFENLLFDILKQKQTEDQQTNRENLIGLLNQVIVSEQNHLNNNDNDDLEEFYQFTQKYNQYKSMLSQQSLKQKNMKKVNNKELGDYSIFLKIKSIQNPALQKELMAVLLQQ